MTRAGDRPGLQAEVVRTPPPEGLGRYAILALYVFALLFMVRNFDLGFNIGDEGVATMDAWRIYSGQIPHRDFFEIIPPFSFLPTVLFFKLFGLSILSERLLVLVYGMALVLVTERLLARHKVGSWGRCLAMAILVPFGVYYWPMPSHHWVADLLQLAALLALLEILEGIRPMLWGVLAGALCALAFFSLQDQGAYFILALGGLFFPWIRDRKTRNRSFLGWAVGGGIVAIAFALYLLPHVSLPDLWYQWVTFPAGRYKNIPGNAPGVFGGWESVFSVWDQPATPSWAAYSTGLTVSVGFLFSLPLTTAVILLLAYGKRWLTFDRLGLLAAGALAFEGTCMHRWSLTNLVWAAPILLVLFGLMIGRAEVSRHRGFRVGARVISGTLIVCSLSYAVLYSAFSSQSHRTRLVSRIGSVGSVLQGETEAVQQLITAVERFVPEDGVLFVDGYMPLVNFLTQRPNPTRFNYFYYPRYNTEDQRAEVTRILEGRPCFIIAALPREPDNPFDRYLQDHYRVAWANSRALLYVPPSPEGETDGLMDRPHP